MRSFLLLILSIFIFRQAAGNGYNNHDSIFKPRFYLYVGGFSPEITTSLRIDSKTAHVGTVLSLEKSLNFEERPTLFRFDGTAKISKRSGAAVSFLSIRRSRSWVMDKDITYGDTTFKAGASANMYFNTDYWGLSYRYSIFIGPTWSAGLSLGGRWLAVRSGITAESKNFGSYSSNSQYGVPAALLGFHGSAYLTKRLQCRYTWEYLTLNVEGIKIYVFDNNLAIEYYVLKNVGIGGSYSSVSYKVKEIPFSSEFSGELEYTFSGFSFFLAARF